VENTWSMVSAIATCGAAIATAFAAVVAIVAMRSWRVQEKHKAFQTYKMSLEVYRIALTILPKDFSPLNSAQHYSSSDRHRNDAINSFTKCSEAWAGYSVHQISDEERKVLDELYSASNSYLYYGASRVNVEKPLGEAQKIKFETLWDRINKELLQ